MAKRKKPTEKERTKDKNIESEKNRKSQTKEQKKILKGVFITICFIVIAFILFLIISDSLSKFKYQGVEFEVVKFCDAGPPCLITYKTSLPVKVIDNNTAVIVEKSKKDTDYLFYFRNDPRKLKVLFNGSVRFAENMVLNSEEGFFCDGYGAIAGANFNQLFKVLRTNVVTDKNAMCDQEQRYVFIEVKPGDETRIEEYSRSCYNIYIKDCEILKGTEKFMIEALIKVNEDLREADSQK